MSKAPPAPKTAAARFYQAKSYRPEESVAYLMRQILNGLAQEVEKQLVHTELTNAQWIPLYKLHSGQASTMAELARGCNLDAGAMTRTLDRLEAKGLCRRVRSETDRRVVHIELTDSGKIAAADIPHALSRVQNNSLSGFTPEEFETLKGFLRRIIANGPSQKPDTTP